MNLARSTPSVTPETERSISFAQAIREATVLAMAKNPKVLVFGLGVTDPKGVFGTTLGLEERFGSERVFDTPTSENALTGMGVGLCLQGYRPIMVHQRLDFFLLAMDQLVNNAAKWHYMFAGQNRVPMVIRLILGKGWGQGPTHSQSLQAWFAHIPGLKVVMPSLPSDAAGLLLSSIEDNNPVIFMEHRWLHHQEGVVEEPLAPVPLGKARVLNEGSDITIVSSSYLTVEALRAVKFLSNHQIHCDLIDLRTIKPWDKSTVQKSVEKTGRLLVLDTAAESFGVASEIVATISIQNFKNLKDAPGKLASPDYPVPTSPALSGAFYPTAVEIASEVTRKLGVKISLDSLKQTDTPHDVPGSWFRGPF